MMLRKGVFRNLQRKINNSILQMTTNQDKWELSNLVAWTLERNVYPVTFQDGGKAISSDPSFLSNEILNYWMATFIQNSKRQNASPYPPIF